MFRPGFISAGVSALSFVASATAPTGSTVTVPAGAQAGDLGVFMDIAIGSGVAAVTPSGHTVRLSADDGGVSARLIVSTKILTGAEAGNSITGMNGATQNNKKYLVFRPNGPITSLASSVWTQQQSGNDPSPQSILAAGQTPPLVVLGIAFCNDNTSNQFDTESPAFDAVIGVGSSRMTVGYKIYNRGSTPADHTIDMIDEGAGNWLAGGYLRVS